ncbi:MAG: APC family permease [Mycoplasma sp.]
MFNKNKKQTEIAGETPTIATQPKSKKIGFFAAMLIVMGSSIGAGIFFKAKGVLEYSQGSLVFAILAWVIAAFAVISMALALLEIASARNDNLSLIGWCKVFNSRAIYKASKNFMFYIYLPLTYFFMPLYAIMSIQDALAAFADNGDIYAGKNTFGTSVDWLLWTFISLAISGFFIFVSGRSSRAGSVINMGIMAIKFLPLVAVMILGFVVAGMSGANVSAGPVSPENLENISSKSNITNFGFMSPGIGIFMAIGAIFFAYDGFYATAGLQTEMKEPKRTPAAIVIGLGIVTFVYLMIAISMSINGNGGLFGIGEWLAGENLAWLFGVINLAIGIGILGIINAFAMWGPRFTEDLIREGELPLSERYLNKLNAHKPMVGICYSWTASIVIIILFTIIGALGYIGDSYQEAGGWVMDNGKAVWQTKEVGSLYGIGMDKLYQFSDLMATWTAVFAFMFIMLPITGGLRNRKQNFVQVEKNKHFVWSAWVSSIIIGIVLLFLFIEAIVNVFWLTQLAVDGWKDGAAAFVFNYTDEAGNIDPDKTFTINASLDVEAIKAQITAEMGWTNFTLVETINNFNYYIGGVDGIIGRVMLLVTLALFVTLTFLPTYIEDKIRIKNHGSLENFERIFSNHAAANIQAA